MSTRKTSKPPNLPLASACVVGLLAALSPEGCALIAGVEEGVLAGTAGGEPVGGAAGSGGSAVGASGGGTSTGSGATGGVAGGAGQGGAGQGGAGAGGPTYSDVVLSDSPLAYWRLGEDTTPVAHDATGNGHDGTFIGGVTVGQLGAIAGDPDTAVHFDGAAEVTVGDVFGFEGTVPFSAEAWIKPETGAGSFIGKAAKPGATYIGWQIYFQADLLAMRRATILDCQGALPPQDEFTHVVATYDGVTLRLYSNGTEVGVRSTSADVPAHTEPFTLGRTYQWGAFQGVMDEVAVYGTSLSPARIQAHYDKGIGTSR